MIERVSMERLLDLLYRILTSFILIAYFDFVHTKSEQLGIANFIFVHCNSIF